MVSYSDMKNGLRVGGGFAAGAASILFWVYGAAFFQGITFHEKALVGSGSTVQINLAPSGETGTGWTAWAYTGEYLSGTGGKANYHPCRIDFPSDKMSGTASGAWVRQADLQIDKAKWAVAYWDCGFVNTALLYSSSGSGLQNFSNKPAGTGALIRFSTGSTLWRKSESFVCDQATNSGSGVTGRCGVEWMERYYSR